MVVSDGADLTSEHFCWREGGRGGERGELSQPFPRRSQSGGGGASEYKRLAGSLRRSSSCRIDVNTSLITSTCRRVSPLPSPPLTHVSAICPHPRSEWTDALCSSSSSSRLARCLHTSRSNARAVEEAHSVTSSARPTQNSHQRPTQGRLTAIGTSLHASELLILTLLYCSIHHCPSLFSSVQNLHPRFHTADHVHHVQMFDYCFCLLFHLH